MPGPSQASVVLGFSPKLVKTCPVKPLPHPSFLFSAAPPVLAALCLSGLLLPATATASALYRCKDAQGVTAYTSTRAGYQQCSLIGNFPPERKAAPAQIAAQPAEAGSSASAPTAAPAAVEFRTAPGDAEPKKVAAPASATPRVMRGAVYKYERNGVTHYTNQRPAGQRSQVLFTYIETCFACGSRPGVDFNNVGLNLTAFTDEINAAMARHGVEEALVRAIIHAESAFNPNAVSRVGAQGLMQLMPATAARFGVSDAFEPAQNIDGGVGYLAWLSQRFDGDLNRIAAGYNAGEGAVDRHGGVPPYQETIVFVERVGILRDRYRKELLAKTGPTAAAVTAASVPAGGS